MTWVIGASPMMGGYAATISDVQVSFGGNRPSLDILRKTYPVGPSLIAGFAGSVYIGFELLRSISAFLRRPREAPPNCGWIPSYVAEHWAPIARLVFERTPDHQRELGSEFLLVGPHPTEDVGIPGRAMAYICKFSGPEFAPEITRGGQSATSIGSGAQVPAYVRGVQEVMAPANGLLQAEVGNEGGWAHALSIAVSFILQEHPEPGISPHVHVHVMRREGYSYSNNDRTMYPREGAPIEFRMPRVAQSYDELVRMLDELDAPPALAVC